MIQDRVIHEYYDEIELAKQPGYVSRYDDFEFEFADSSRPKPARFDPPHGHPGRIRAPSAAERCRAKTERIVPPLGARDAPAPPPKPTPPTPGKSEDIGAGIFPDS